MNSFTNHKSLLFFPLHHWQKPQRNAFLLTVNLGDLSQRSVGTALSKNPPGDVIRIFLRRRLPFFVRFQLARWGVWSLGLVRNWRRLEIAHPPPAFPRDLHSPPPFCGFRFCERGSLPLSLSPHTRSYFSFMA
ncbi:hypothetical protein AVEN_192802-1 [Araneus ventricosus]|uniref:Uncharacterized protein n=1 Tax=Araneus ventricosus TaxID=182803 RepID=A0A4Y2TBI0_ARAVE|nr:hypothetical protein AVEN_60616-1 [Araneus ventricosus]GBN97340.1 hypothetical protein AVEN_192802-1 [Araneus ventricosus]